jgi:AraC family transcriptional regulator
MRPGWGARNSPRCPPGHQNRNPGQVLARRWRYFKGVKAETRSYYETLVGRAVEQILSELDQALDLSLLAKTAALSPLHFHRIFRGVVGETPLELHRRLRLERAAHELATSDAPVTRLAFEAGYETHESFTRAFGEHYGCSPSAFRESASASANANPAPAGCARPPQVELAAPSRIHFQQGEVPAPGFVMTRLKQGESIMQVDIKQLSEMRVAALRHVGAYNRISEAFERLGGIAGPAGIIGPNSKMVALYHDDPEATPVDQLRSDAAITVSNHTPLPSGLTEIRIPAGRYACTTYVGPYSGLGDAWSQFMGGWLPKSEHRLGDGPTFEIYVNDPRDTPAAELRTEIYLPIA